MKPFLLLQSRPEPEAADNEYEAFYQFGGLKPQELVRIAMNLGELGEVDLNAYSGIILGGGPGNVTDAPEKKTPAERKFEPKLYALLAKIVQNDTPFLGACLGVGLLTNALGGVVSKKYGEPVGPVAISLAPAASDDPLLAGLPNTFDAFVGHKEACETLPSSAVLLASSPTCPVQMFRLGRNVYATQFHPELDAHGLELRINIYKHAGYFQPDEVDRLTRIAHSASVTIPERILKRFVDQYSVSA
jgi:GMP synthase (glutamine-hydrolysing)